jgi:membrane protease YdiL (CAAX protease family)
MVGGERMKKEDYLPAVIVLGLLAFLTFPIWLFGGLKYLFGENGVLPILIVMCVIVYVALYFQIRAHLKKSPKMSVIKK